MKKDFLVPIFFHLFVFCIISRVLTQEVISIKGTKFGNSLQTGKVIVSGTWGIDIGEFGKIDKAARPGPMSFAVDKENNIFILDQVNSRVQKFDNHGKYLASLNINTTTAADIVLDQEGKIYILDPWIEYNIKRFSTTGKLEKVYNISKDIKLITGMFINDSEIFVESRHDELYKVATLDKIVTIKKQHLNPMMGRLGKGGKKVFLSAEKVDNWTARLDVRAADGIITMNRIINSQRPYSSIVSLDSDQQGNIYLGLNLLWESGPPDYEVLADQLVVVAFTPNGKYVGQVEMPNQYVTDHFKKIVVNDLGDIYQLQTSEEGINIIKWQFVKN